MKIDNSRESAVQNGKWSSPGASFYDKLMEEENWKSLLNEAYLVAPDKGIRNTEDERTSFSASGCKYPHHEIRGGKLVVSVPGIRAAYSRAAQQGILNGDVKSHLEKHIRELGMQDSFKSSKMSWNESVDSDDMDFVNKVVALERKILDGEITYDEVKKSLDDLEQQYGKDVFPGFILKKKPKPWSRKYLNELNEKRMAGATSKEFILHLAEVSDYVHKQEAAAKAVAGTAGVVGGAVLTNKLVKHIKKKQDAKKSKRMNSDYKSIKESIDTSEALGIIDESSANELHELIDFIYS